MIIKLKTFQRFLILSHRGAVFALAVVSAILSSTGFADDNRKLPKICALFFQDQPTAAPYQRALRDGLRELGYVDGKTATFVTRFADGDATKLSALMADILAQKVDVIWVGR